MGDQVRGRADYLLLGDWNAACSMCGRKRKAGELVQNWQGLWRCPEHNEPRQPQDFVRGVQDIQTPPWAQLQTDLEVSVCTLNGRSAIPGWAIPGCAIPGNSFITPPAGLYGMVFTTLLDGQTNGVISEPILFGPGTYKTVFNDNEIRQVLYDGGVNASWVPALNVGGGVQSAYVNIGTL